METRLYSVFPFLNRGGAFFARTRSHTQCRSRLCKYLFESKQLKESKSIFHISCNVIMMSCNHLVRFWLQYIFYYFVRSLFVFCFLVSSLSCEYVCMCFSRFYLLFLAYGQLSVQPFCPAQCELLLLVTADCWSKITWMKWMNARAIR